MRNFFINKLLDAAKKDSSILLLTGDLGYGVLDEFANILPTQFINFGINEQSMMSAAGGLANKGFKPFVYSIGNFPTFRCLEQIRNDVCYMNANVTIVSLGAGFGYGTAGYSHHLIEDLSIMSALPNMSIFSPADNVELKQAMDQILDHSGPKYIRLGKSQENQSLSSLNRDNYGYSIFEGSSDTAIVSTGDILNEVFTAIELIDSELDRPTIISVYDFNRKILSSLTQRFKQIITVEEHLLSGGLGSKLVECSTGNNQKFIKIGIEKIHSEQSGNQQHLRKAYKLNAEFIAETIVKTGKEF